MLIYTAANVDPKNAGDPVPNTILCSNTVVYQHQHLVSKLVKKKQYLYKTLTMM